MPGRGRGRGRQPSREPAPPQRGRSRSPRAGASREEVQHDMDNWWQERAERLRSLREETPPPQLPPPPPPAPEQATVSAGDYKKLLDRLDLLEKKVTVQGDLIDPLNLTVQPDLREKIWEGKCVDFANLLVKSHQEREEKDKKITGFQDKDGNISFKTVKPKKSNLSIDQWSSAFNVYMSVYILKKPEDIQGLLSYAELIRGAARDHPTSSGWRDYDGEFRSKKEPDPARPWGMIDNQLWLSIFCKPPGQKDDQAKGEKSRVDKECMYFNSKEGCFKRSCKYTHKCHKCASSLHPTFKCYGLKNKSKSEDKGSKSDDAKKMHDRVGQGSQNHSFRGGK